MTENRCRTGLVVTLLLAVLAACTGGDATPPRPDRGRDRIAGEELRRAALDDGRLRATHAGHTLHGRYPSGASWRLLIGADGTARIEGRTPRATPTATAGGGRRGTDGRASPGGSCAAGGSTAWRCSPPAATGTWRSGRTAGSTRPTRPSRATPTALTHPCPGGTPGLGDNPHAAPACHKTVTGPPGRRRTDRSVPVRDVSLANGNRAARFGGEVARSSPGTGLFLPVRRVVPGLV